MTISKSDALYQRALKIMPGGCSRNTVLRKPHPLYASHGEGCHLIDVDGVSRIDFANNMAAHIHGHSHPKIVEAVTTQVQKGTAYTFATDVEIEYAEHMIGRCPSFEKIRFVNSGTEAVMGCLKAARAFTGRPKIAKVEGAYHGLYDFAEVSQTASPENWGDKDHPRSVPVSHGTPQSALDDVIVIPFNDIETSLNILEKHGQELACILVDLMPHRVALHPAERDYVQVLARWAKEQGSLFVCDEVITFRSEFSGAQTWYDIKPDLTAMGKMIGGGFPVGALAGRADIMEVMNPLSSKVLFPHSGTFSANPVTMTAGLTAMKLFDETAVKNLNNLGHYARNSLAEVISIAGMPVCVTGAGSMLRLHMRETPPTNYREAYQSEDQKAAVKFLLDHLFDHGCAMINTCSAALSTVMTVSEIDALSQAVLIGLQNLKRSNLNINWA